MRFLMICMQYPLGPGESYMTTELADALVAEGHEVQVLLLDWHGEAGQAPDELTSPTGVRVLRCSPRRVPGFGRVFGDASKFLLSGRHLARVARSRLDLRSFDVALAWMPLTAIAPLVPLLSRAGIRHRLLFIWDFFPDHHRQIGRIPSGLAFAIARFCERRLLRHFDTIFCTLPGNADYLRQRYPLTAGQSVRIAPIWCTTERRKAVDRAAPRRDYELPADRPIAVFGGQLVALVVAVGAGVLTLFVTCAASSFAIARIEDQAVVWPSVADLAAGLGSGWLVMAMWASLGAVFAVLLRSVALPIGLGVVWILGIETLLAGVVSSLLPSLDWLANALPGTNAGSLVFSVTGMAAADAPPGVRDAVGGGRALLTLIGYCAVFAVLAAWTTRRRDVT